MNDRVYQDQLLVVEPTGIEPVTLPQMVASPMRAVRPGLGHPRARVAREPNLSYYVGCIAAALCTYAFARIHKGQHLHATR